MSISIDRTVTRNTPRYGSNGIDCGGTTVRAHSRHLATVVTVDGAIRDTNVDEISAYSRRFVLAGTRYILDLSGVDAFTASGIRFLCHVDDECRAAGVEWAMVPSDSVIRMLSLGDDESMFPTAESLSEALHYFADEIGARRRLLLPLITKTAS